MTNEKRHEILSAAEIADVSDGHGPGIDSRRRALRAAETPGPASAWKVGVPIVTYWAGPAMTDKVAQQMVDGGWNLVWCTEKELDVAQRHHLRAQLQDGLLSPQVLDHPAERAKLDALVARVRTHPALYNYFVRDEPSAADFPALARLVAYLHEHDPAHLAYINLFPTYADNKQLRHEGRHRYGLPEVSASVHRSGEAGAFELRSLPVCRQGRHGRLFSQPGAHASNRPAERLAFSEHRSGGYVGPFDSYSHRRRGALSGLYDAGLRAQGISYYVYCCPGHKGMIALANGTPTPLYHTLKSVNREFAAIAGELQPLRSLGVYHAGMTPPGAEPLGKNVPFRLDPPVPAMAYKAPERVRGVLLGVFGPVGKDHGPGKPTHVLVVNLDYKAKDSRTIVGPGKLEIFDAARRTWSAAADKGATLDLPPGGGKLLRVQEAAAK